MALLVLAIVLSAGAAWALGVASPSINWDVVAGGGGYARSTAVVIGDTVGQPIIGFAQSGAVEVGSGYWYGAGVPAPAGTATPSPTRPPGPTYTPTPTVRPGHKIYMPLALKGRRM